MLNCCYLELLKIKKIGLEFFGKAELLDQTISGFSIDSRKIEADQIFIAIPGERFDGHQFVSEVARQGVQNFIVKKKWFQLQQQSLPKGNYFVVSDTLLALQAISHYYRMKFHFPFLALTGSNGKTTTKEMIAAVLANKYKVLKTEGNLNNQIGVPLTLFNLKSDHQIAIIEMGTNRKGEIAKLAQIVNPTHGVITSIGPAHLEFFGSIQGVFEAKNELWQFLEKQGQTAFINNDDRYLSRNLPKVNNIIKYGFEKKADVKGKFIGINRKGQPSFMVRGEKINLKIAGIHNIYNALCAVSVSLHFSMDMPEIKYALESFQPASKRMEMVEKKGIIIINDCYNSNPESAKKALLTLSQMASEGRRIAVLGDMFELGRQAKKEHKKIGEYLASLKNIDLLLTVGHLSKLTCDSAKNSNCTNSFHFEDKQKLIESLLSIIKKKDLILIKGSRGMAMEEVSNAVQQTLS